MEIGDFMNISGMQPKIEGSFPVQGDPDLPSISQVSDGQYIGNFPKGDLRSISQKLQSSHVASRDLKERGLQKIVLDTEKLNKQSADEEWNEFKKSTNDEFVAFCRDISNTYSKRGRDNEDYRRVYVAWFLGLISREQALDLMLLCKKRAAPHSLDRKENLSLEFQAYYDNWVGKKLFQTSNKSVQVALPVFRILVTLLSIGNLNGDTFLSNIVIDNRTLSEKKRICSSSIEITYNLQLSRLSSAFAKIRAKEQDNANVIEQFLGKLFAREVSLLDFVLHFSRMSENFLIAQTILHPDELAEYPVAPLQESCSLSEERISECWDHLFALQAEGKLLASEASEAPEGYREFLIHMFHMDDCAIVSCIFCIFQCLDFFSDKKGQEALLREVADKFDKISPLTLISFFLCYQQRTASLGRSRLNEKDPRATTFQKLLQENIGKFKGFSSHLSIDPSYRIARITELQKDLSALYQEYSAKGSEVDSR